MPFLKNENTNLNHPDFSKGNRYAWLYSLENAKVVLNRAIYFSNFFNLLSKNQFFQDLNLHKSVDDLRDADWELDEINEYAILYSPFYTSSLSKQDYFDTLKVSN